jgi:hypothetical protein
MHSFFQGARNLILRFIETNKTLSKTKGTVKIKNNGKTWEFSQGGQGVKIHFSLFPTYINLFPTSN